MILRNHVARYRPLECDAKSFNTNVANDTNNYEYLRILEQKIRCRAEFQSFSITPIIYLSQNLSNPHF